MAVANHRVRVFKDVSTLEDFIRTDVDISSIVTISTDDNGTLILVYDVT